MGVKWVEVAAGVIIRADGRFLLGRRAEGTFYPGYWEFPGGKVEAGERPADALVRELDEELGIRVERLYPWLVREHVYEHASVRLNFFEVPAWSGEIHDRVHSALSWERVGAPEVKPMLPANGPILKILRLPRSMGITHAASVGVAAQLESVEGALARGLRLIRIREPSMPPAALESFSREVMARARDAGALVIVSDDLDLANRVGADGVHLTGTALRAASRRPDFEWVGASCHDRAELERAASLDLDYALLGAVCPTPSHPDREGLGWSAFTELARALPMAVFALGGLGPRDMEAARQAGAHGIAAIRTAWAEAQDLSAASVASGSGGVASGIR